MDLYKKILIAIIIVIFTYIIWRLLARRQEISKQMEKFQGAEGFIEGADPLANELKSIQSSSPVNIQSVTSYFYNLPLIEFLIKGSYNSAFTGTYINTEMIKYLASRGCRFYDFEVYYIADEKGNFTPQVGVSTDPKFKVMTSENTVLLDNILSTVVASSFSQTSPNNKDPVFINLRMKLTDYTSAPAYQAIAASVDYALKSKLFNGKVTNQTPFRNIMGKVVLLVDKTEFYDYAMYTGCNKNVNKSTCYDLSKYVNMESGSETLNIVKYSEVANQLITPVIVKDDNLHTDVKKMKLAYPDDIPRANPIIYDFVKKYGCQIVPYRFYYNDNNLTDYENFFSVNSSAFVAYADAIQYLSKDRTESKLTTV